MIQLWSCSKKSRALNGGLMVIGVGKVVGVLHLFVCHVFVMLFMQIIRIWTHFSLTLINFCHMNLKPMDWNLHFQLLIDDHA